MKSIINKINEGRETRYSVAFIGCTDNEGMPIKATIIVDNSDAKDFEKFLVKEQDNLFAHAAGGNLEEEY